MGFRLAAAGFHFETIWLGFAASSALAPPVHQFGGRLLVESVSVVVCSTAAMVDYIQGGWLERNLVEGASRRSGMGCRRGQLRRGNTDGSNAVTTGAMLGCKGTRLVSALCNSLAFST